MWVHRARMAYVGRSSGPDWVTAYVHIRDTNRAMVPNAVVTATWTFTSKDGSVVTHETQTRESTFQGIAHFRLWKGSGTYQICVDDVTKIGWEYDPESDRDVCPTFKVW